MIFTARLCDFVESCLRRDQKDRLTADQLLRLDFITHHQQQFQSWQFHHRQEHVTPNLEPSVLEEGDWRATPLQLTGDDFVKYEAYLEKTLGRQSEAWFFSAETLGDEKVRAALEASPLAGS